MIGSLCGVVVEAWTAWDLGLRDALAAPPRPGDDADGPAAAAGASGRAAGPARPAPLAPRRPGESDEALARRRMALELCLVRLVHATVQGGLAVGLLGAQGAGPLRWAGLRPWPARRTATLGVVASALNCYLLMPPRPGSK